MLAEESPGESEGFLEEVSKALGDQGVGAVQEDQPDPGAQLVGEAHAEGLGDAEDKEDK